MEVVIASKNAGKINEYKRLLGDNFTIISEFEAGFNADVKETADSFIGNAIIKARAVYDFCHKPTIADDSGLSVDCLDGAPGIYSARYAAKDGHNATDKDNYTLLLKNMEGKTDRKAHFETAIAMYDGVNTYIACGKTFGEILLAPQGTNGFGYDPVFFSYELKKSFGLATSDEKNKVSHRKKAVDNLLKILKNAR